jgi:hypothetical protein
MCARRWPPPRRPVRPPRRRPERTPARRGRLLRGLRRAGSGGVAMVRARARADRPGSVRVRGTLAHAASPRWCRCALWQLHGMARPRRRVLAAGGARWVRCPRSPPSGAPRLVGARCALSSVAAGRGRVSRSPGPAHAAAARRARAAGPSAARSHALQCRVPSEAPDRIAARRRRGDRSGGQRALPAVSRGRAPPPRPRPRSLP